mgnify:FL=1
MIIMVIPITNVFYTFFITICVIFYNAMIVLTNVRPYYVHISWVHTFQFVLLLLIYMWEYWLLLLCYYLHYFSISNYEAVTLFSICSLGVLFVWVQASTGASYKGMSSDKLWDALGEISWTWIAWPIDH